MEEIDGEQTLEGEVVDKLHEFEELRRQLKLLRADLKELKGQHEHADEINQLTKKLKALREEVIQDEQINEITEKLKEKVERFDLVKEMIRIEMVEKGEDEKEVGSRRLKIVKAIKDLKSNGPKKNEIHPDQIGFSE